MYTATFIASPFKYLYELYEPVVHPPSVKRRPKEGGQLEVPKLPLAFEPDLFFIVSGYLTDPHTAWSPSIGAGRCRLGRGTRFP